MFSILGAGPITPSGKLALTLPRVAVIEPSDASSTCSSSRVVTPATAVSWNSAYDQATTPPAPSDTLHAGDQSASVTLVSFFTDPGCPPAGSTTVTAYGPEVSLRRA